RRPRSARVLHRRNLPARATRIHRGRQGIAAAAPQARPSGERMPGWTDRRAESQRVRARARLGIPQRSASPKVADVSGYPLRRLTAGVAGSRIVIAKSTPDRDDFVRLSGIDVEGVLEQGMRRSGHPILVNGSELV